MKTLSNWRHKRAKLQSLNSHETGLLIRVLLVLTICRGLLLVLPFNRFMAASRRSTTLSNDLSQSVIDEIVWAINVVSANVPLGSTCLVQALTIRWMLRRHADIQIHIGVRKSAVDGFAAHAWASYQGKTILGAQVDNQAFEPILQWS